MLTATLLSETLRLLLQVTLVLLVVARLLPWVEGLEQTAPGRFLKSIEELLCFPLRRLLCRFTERYPTALDLPFVLTALLLLVLSISLPYL